jgi:hypothetical protein
MNKTQTLLIERLEGKHGQGSLKNGWIRYNDGSISLQKLNEGDQALKLAEKYPDKFQATYKAWRLVSLKKLA